MPVSSKNIRRNLNLIRERYDDAMNSSRTNSSLEAALYSKLAIIELSGWIEETIDIILKDYLIRTVNDHTIRNTIEQEIIQRVYGFKYKDYYRPLMERILGASRFQYITLKLEHTNARNSRLQNVLSELTKRRDQAAHTHFQQGITACFDSPSWTINQFDCILPIFRSIERMVKNMK